LGRHVCGIFEALDAIFERARAGKATNNVTPRAEGTHDFLESRKIGKTFGSAFQVLQRRASPSDTAVNDFSGIDGFDLPGSLSTTASSQGSSPRFVTPLERGLPGECGWGEGQPQCCH